VYRLILTLVASVFRRGAATVTDLGVITVWLFFSVTYFAVHLNNIAEIWALLIAYGIPIVGLVLDGARQKATFGMRIWRIVLRTKAETDPSFFHSLGRFVVGFIFVPLFPVSWLIAYFDEQHRSLADLVCGTSVRFYGEHLKHRGFDVVPTE